MLPARGLRCNVDIFALGRARMDQQSGFAKGCHGLDLERDIRWGMARFSRLSHRTELFNCGEAHVELFQFAFKSGKTEGI